nr:RNA-directed DNA polymerase, eukaryota [Tanacetum cinerariifolium]
VASLLCPLCDSGMEDAAHLFFRCDMAKDVMFLVSRWWDLEDRMFSSFQEWLAWFNSIWLGAKSKGVLEGVFYISWWSIWNFKNLLLFEVKKPRKDVIFDDIVLRSFNWRDWYGRGCKLAKSIIRKEVAEMDMLKAKEAVKIQGERRKLERDNEFMEIINASVLRVKTTMIRWVISYVGKNYNKVRSWIRGSLSSGKDYILVNGSPTPEFHFHRGLKQGDPLAPFLFLLIMESLHLSFSRAVETRIFTGMSINIQKSHLLGVGIPDNCVAEAAKSIGCSIMKAPFKYLGIL